MIVSDLLEQPCNQSDNIDKVVAQQALTKLCFVESFIELEQSSMVPVGRIFL